MFDPFSTREYVYYLVIIDQFLQTYGKNNYMESTLEYLRIKNQLLCDNQFGFITNLPAHNC